MQASERYRLTELYRDEIAGRHGPGVKLAAAVSALSVLALAAGSVLDGAAETPTHAIARPDGHSAYVKEAVADNGEVVSLAPAITP